MQNTASGTPGQDEVSEANPSPPPSVAELFTGHEGALLAYAQNLVKDNETAQDIVQEAFIKLHRKPFPG